VFGTTSGGVEGPKGYRVISDVKNESVGTHVFRVQVMADGKYVKVYMDGVRVANAPNADVGRSNKLTFGVKADAAHPVLVGNVRVAAGGKDLYRALEETGRVTADGIFFDTSSDRIRPESEPVLTQIGEMLAQHAEMRVAIEGHTDNVGQAAANQALSEKRAAAVKAYLVSKHGVDAARVEAKGFGATKPVAPNADEAGRQKNRRVELVKI
jgi:OmpA-OmpF porin, OOP family